MIIDKNSLSLEDLVFAKLEEEILSGELKRGTALKEQALSARLGVSRTPVRGALNRLSEEGLIELCANRGAVVLGVSKEDLKDTYEIRMRLEGLASRLAAERISETDKAALTDAVELSEFYIKKNDAEHLKELDTEFHRIIYRAADNRLLCKILTDLHRNIKGYRKLSLSTPDRVESSVKEHREILEAILASDAETADKLTSKHIAAAMENLLSKELISSKM